MYYKSTQKSLLSYFVYECITTIHVIFNVQTLVTERRGSLSLLAQYPKAKENNK